MISLKTIRILGGKTNILNVLEKPLDDQRAVVVCSICICE